MPPAGVTAPIWRAVLFDLDGTLVDSAPDLIGAGNDMRVARQLAALPYERLRPMASAGARGIVGAALGARPGEPQFEGLRDEFLARYEQRLLRLTRVFDDMHTVIDALDAAGVPWGIVTNKAERFTRPVVEGLGLARRAAVVISGDTTPHAKPHPEPLLEAARRMDLAAATCVYVGDDLRDMQAGQAAGMATVAAGWGYLGDGDPIEAWGAEIVAREPLDLLNWLRLA
jgi:phosphoglycolate phosphatase